ncbi:MAG: hypothetical protein Q8930_01240 [Bacillota bacterium]|nr:hypothetical protein [Bacillota bacterium]
MVPSEDTRPVNGNSHYQRSEKEMKDARNKAPKDAIREKNDERSRVSSPSK